MVKRSRRRPLKAKSWVQFPLALPQKITPLSEKVTEFFILCPYQNPDSFPGTPADACATDGVTVSLAVLLRFRQPCIHAAAAESCQVQRNVIVAQFLKTGNNFIASIYLCHQGDLGRFHFNAYQGSVTAYPDMGKAQLRQEIFCLFDPGQLFRRNGLSVLDTGVNPSSATYA